MPDNLLPSALYYVRVGSGFDLVLTNSSGEPIMLNTPVSTLGPPDEFTVNDLFVYTGWTSVGGSWLIHRLNRLTSARHSAIIGGNAVHLDFSSAWADVENLVYI